MLTGTCRVWHSENYCQIPKGLFTRFVSWQIGEELGSKRNASFIKNSTPPQSTNRKTSSLKSQKQDGEWCVHEQGARLRNLIRGTWVQLRKHGQFQMVISLIGASGNCRGKHFWLCKYPTYIVRCCFWDTEEQKTMHLLQAHWLTTVCLLRGKVKLLRVFLKFGKLRKGFGMDFPCHRVCSLMN